MEAFLVVPAAASPRDQVMNLFTARTTYDTFARWMSCVLYNAQVVCKHGRFQNGLSFSQVNDHMPADLKASLGIIEPRIKQNPELRRLCDEIERMEVSEKNLALCHEAIEQVMARRLEVEQAIIDNDEGRRALLPEFGDRDVISDGGTPPHPFAISIEDVEGPTMDEPRREISFTRQRFVREFEETAQYLVRALGEAVQAEQAPAEKAETKKEEREPYRSWDTICALEAMKEHGPKRRPWRNRMREDRASSPSPDGASKK